MADHIAHALGVLSLLVFAGAGGFSLYAIAVTIAPEWGRIARLASGRLDAGADLISARKHEASERAWRTAQ